MKDGPIQGQFSPPYQTNNAALAIVLHMAGVKWVSMDGVIIPGFNFYSRAFLEEKGYGGKDINESIATLFAKGVPGQVVYTFAREEGSTVIHEIVDGWDSMAEAIQKADSANPDAGTGLPIPPKEFREIGQIACLFAKTRKDFFGGGLIVPLWRRRDASGRLFIPTCRAIEGASRTEHGDKGQTFHYGSMKLKSVKV